MAVKACTYPPPVMGQVQALQSFPDISNPFLVREEPARPVAPAIAVPRRLEDFNLNDRQTLYFLSVLQRATYSTTDTWFKEAAQAVVPISTPITFIPNSGLTTPGYGLVNLPEVAILCISGTTNLAQWMDQIFLGNLVNTAFANNDSGKALSTYVTAANTIDQAIAAQVPGNKAILLVGHSMGGAVATVLHAKYGFGARQFKSRCLSFSAPKAGNDDFVNNLLLHPPYWKRLFLFGDFVPSLPPASLGILKAAILASPLAAAFSWDLYEPAGTPYTVSAAGAIESAEQPWLPNLIINALLAAALGQPVAIGPPHSMRNMTRNLRASFSDFTEPVISGWRTPDDLDTINTAMDAAGIN